MLRLVRVALHRLPRRPGVLVLAVVLAGTWVAVASGPEVGRDRQAPAGPVARAPPAGPVARAVADTARTDGVADPRTGRASFLMDRYQLSALEASSQLDHQAWADRTAKVDRWAEQPGWAGQWIDRTATGTVVLQATAPATVAALRAKGYPDWVRVRRVERSAADLARLRAAVVAEVAGAGGGSEVHVTVSVERDRVEVRVPDGSSGRAGLEAREGVVLLRS